MFLGVESGGFDLLAFLEKTWLTVEVILGIGLMIFIHELGHFLAAKKSGKQHLSVPCCLGATSPPADYPAPGTCQSHSAMLNRLISTPWRGPLHTNTAAISACLSQ